MHVQGGGVAGWVGGILQPQEDDTPTALAAQSAQHNGKGSDARLALS
jgi:hypothetical protein